MQHCGKQANQASLCGANRARALPPIANLEWQQHHQRGLMASMHALRRLAKAVVNGDTIPIGNRESRTTVWLSWRCVELKLKLKALPQNERTVA